jgi:3-oxoacyl-[acyl-carrier protein] reductase
VGLTRQLALELGPHGITVNSVAPGFVPSNPSTRRQWEAFGPGRQAQVIEGTHMRRLGSPEDIAHAVTFLASDKAAWITGQVLSVDGGRA